MDMKNIFLRMLLAFGLVVSSLGGAALVTAAPASAGNYLTCPNAGSRDEWWIMSTVGVGQTAHCVVSGNHATIDLYNGATNLGNQWNSWLPGFVDWYTFPGPNGGQSTMIMCKNLPGSWGFGPPAAGWEHSFAPGNVGALNHWHGVVGHPYRSEGAVSGGTCAGLGSPNNPGIYLTQ